MHGQDPPDASGAQSVGPAERTPRARDRPPESARFRRLFIAATVVDAVGSGLWMPFALLFLVHGQGLPLTDAGVALSLGGLIGLATGPAAGMVMDRIGPLPMLLTSNVIRLVAFCCYPFVSSIWEVALVSAVVSMGDRLFWTGNAPFINAVTTGRDAERVLGTQTMGRFLGAGVGAGATALLPAITSPFAFHLLAYLNAASFGVAALLIKALRTPKGERRQFSAGTTSGGSWGRVLRNRPFVGFCTTHVLFTLASASKYAILPILVRDVLKGSQWIPGAAIGIGTLVIILGQRPITRLVSRWSRATGLIAAAVLFACSFAALAPAAVVPLPVATVLILATSFTFAVAEAMFAPLATAAAAAAAPPDAEGRASALFQLSWGLATVVAPALLTSLLSVGNAILWLTLTATSALAIPALLTLRRTLPGNVLAR